MDIGEDGAEVAGKKRGRPKGQKPRSPLEILTEDVVFPATSRRRTTSPTTSQPPLRPKVQVPATTPKTLLPGSTSTRPLHFIVGRALTSLPHSKLPKCGAVVGRLLTLLEEHSLTEAGKIVTEEVKAVWLEHFGPKLILGKEFGKEKTKANDDLKMIIPDFKIPLKVVGLYKRWRNLERESRRPDRSVKTTHREKVVQLTADLDWPLDIRKTDSEDKVQKSGILDWREEVDYLRSQMTREQAGCLGTFDTRQKKRDERRLKEDLRKEVNTDKIERKERSVEDFEDEEVDESYDENDNDKDFVVKEVKKGKKKIDVMGKISLTCDARNISKINRTIVAASVVNALGLNIEDTNINTTSAWRKGQQVRVAKAKEICDSFQCPAKGVIHWDGKTLFLRGRVESKRVCVYLSGVEEDRSRKLLGIPEAVSGRGVDEFEIVKECMVKWGVKEQVLGMVFDTTASNSGEHSGACRYTQ